MQARREALTEKFAAKREIAASIVSENLLS
jgi:hypothetical protein